MYAFTKAQYSIVQKNESNFSPTLIESLYHTMSKKVNPDLPIKSEENSEAHETTNTSRVKHRFPRNHTTH